MMALSLDINQFTMGELEDLEDALIAAGVVADGTAFQGLFKSELDAAGEPIPKPMPQRIVTTMAWILMRRDRPGLTLADVRAMPLVEFSELMGGAAEPRPTARATRNGSKSGARSQSTTRAGRSTTSAA